MSSYFLHPRPLLTTISIRYVYHFACPDDIARVAIVNAALTTTVNTAAHSRHLLRVVLEVLLPSERYARNTPSPARRPERMYMLYLVRYMAKRPADWSTLTGAGKVPVQTRARKTMPTYAMCVEKREREKECMGIVRVQVLRVEAETNVSNLIALSTVALVLMLFGGR